MRVTIQTSDLDHQRIDGTRVYVRELLRHFGTLDHETQFMLYHQRGFNPSLAPPSFANYIERLTPFPVAWMQTRFAWELFRIHPEKLFLPIQAAPLFLPSTLDVTATIHDLAFKRYPETFPVSHRFKLNLLLDAVVRRADKLIAVSESTREDLLSYYPALDEKKVRVIHHGFDQKFFGTRIPITDLQTILSRHKLEVGSYVLYIGALQPRKNLIRLIQAFEKTKATIPEMRLVLAGETAWLAKSILKTYEQSPYKSDIILTGRISFDEVRALYQGARLFAFPSLYEGFGLPLLEAFASGTPVLTTNNSSLPEVAGDGALYCDAFDVSHIATQLMLLWQDQELRKALIAKGTERLTAFSWERCARETLETILAST